MWEEVCKKCEKKYKRESVRKSVRKYGRKCERKCKRKCERGVIFTVGEEMAKMANIIGSTCKYFLEIWGKMWQDLDIHEDENVIERESDRQTDRQRQT